MKLLYCLLRGHDFKKQDSLLVCGRCGKKQLPDQIKVTSRRQ